MKPSLRELEKQAKRILQEVNSKKLSTNIYNL